MAHKNISQPPNETVNFKTALSDFWKRSLNFTGTSTFDEYWWIEILSIGIAFATFFLTFGLMDAQVNIAFVWGVFILIFLFFELPALSLAVRRLRDTGLTNLSIFGLLFLFVVLTALSGNTDTTLINVISWLINVCVFYFSLRPTGHFVTKQKSGWRTKIFQQVKN